MDESREYFEKELDEFLSKFPGYNPLVILKKGDKVLSATGMPPAKIMSLAFDLADDVHRKIEKLKDEFLIKFKNLPDDEKPDAFEKYVIERDPDIVKYSNCDCPDCQREKEERKKRNKEAQEVLNEAKKIINDRS